MPSERRLPVGMGGLICTPGAAFAKSELPTISKGRREQAMRLAVEQGKKNPFYPYGAVIVRAATGELVASGVTRPASRARCA